MIMISNSSRRFTKLRHFSKTYNRKKQNTKTTVDECPEGKLSRDCFSSFIVPKICFIVELKYNQQRGYILFYNTFLNMWQTMHKFNVLKFKNYNKNDRLLKKFRKPSEASYQMYNMAQQHNRRLCYNR